MLTRLFKQQLLHYQLRRFKKRYQIDNAERHFDKLFAPYNGFQLSARARAQTLDDSLSYGEIDFLHFCLLLKHAAITDDDIFYDLGAGIGKAVIACGLVFPFKHAYGIELLPPLVKTAQSIKENAPEKLQRKISFIEGDFLTQDLSQATIIFINATAFFGEIMDEITNKFKDLNSNCRIIISSKTLPERYFIEQYHTRVLMSWGPANVRIYQPKVTNLNKG